MFGITTLKEKPEEYEKNNKKIEKRYKDLMLFMDKKIESGKDITNKEEIENLIEEKAYYRRLYNRVKTGELREEYRYKYKKTELYKKELIGETKYKSKRNKKEIFSDRNISIKETGVIRYKCNLEEQTYEVSEYRVELFGNSNRKALIYTNIDIEKINKKDHEYIYYLKKEVLAQRSVVDSMRYNGGFVGVPILKQENGKNYYETEWDSRILTAVMKEKVRGRKKRKLDIMRKKEKKENEERIR